MGIINKSIGIIEWNKLSLEYSKIHEEDTYVYKNHVP